MSVSTDPYTPRTRPGGRKKDLDLSAKEYSKPRDGSTLLSKRQHTDVHPPHTARHVSPSFLLDLAHTELKKPAKCVSIVKLQSLLDLALIGEDVVFRKDVRASIASSGLYDWLLKLISVIGGEKGDGVPDEATKKDRDREKDDKNDMLGIDRCPYTRLQREIPAFARHLSQNDFASPAPLPFSLTSQACRTVARIDVDRTEDKSVAASCAKLSRVRVALLRTRILAFVPQILAFMTFNVLEHNWRALVAKLAKVTTVDQVLRDHVDFLDTCLKECMLTSTTLLRAYSRMIVTCFTLALRNSSFTQSAN
ncbi:hypothetical protein F4604DRAFT_1920309 [Suillus subluteus]|nr:hypothetical protein F4604DRAFT_1920309 [Suillus subluteus]